MSKYGHIRLLLFLSWSLSFCLVFGELKIITRPLRLTSDSLSMNCFICPWGWIYNIIQSKIQIS
jgi:hypothetical protein